MLEGPAGTPPPNVIPHLTTHSDDQKWYYLCASLCTGISGAFLLVHLYTRFFVFRKVLPADIFIILGFILSLPCIIIARHSLNFGAGVHIWNLKLKDLIELLFVSPLFIKQTLTRY
ncbi:hypothetical protein P154DRAFT_481464 [Amniculicola lignicola CBS 123094]|uniref:Uncharacterized protein n=1 Tax=Amniculicola lignicola CBS 123094 TaxID=1392246 RepID=A0A6A5X272_9PLEO|nr:hypothetical protein P154DRAFT_481464 [Amniculicola lignicola CBS 123094]